jgi:exonuclease SbcC
MRIKEFIVNRYGPLSYNTPVRLGDFTLLWGENEHGKTLTIDALIKLLLGRNVRDFIQIDRVEENPSGYAVIEDNEGKEIKVPDDGSLTSIASLSASECRNIFVIRNSELLIEREDQFYTEITDRLTGLRTTEIGRLQNILRDLGRLTPGGSLRNTGYEKLKDRIDTARYTCDDIRALIEKVDEKELGNLEKSIVEKEEEIDNIAHQLLLFDEARERERFEKGKDALEKLESAVQKLEPLEIFNNEDLQLWQESETTMSSANAKKSELTKRLQQNEALLQSGIKERQVKERDFQVISEQKRQIDGNVKPALENYKEESAKLATYSSSGRFWNSASIVSTALLAISIIACAIGRVVPLYVVAGILLLTVLIAWSNKFRPQAKSTRLAKLLASINLSLAKYELNADSIEGILSNIQKFEDNHTKKSEELQEMKREEAVLEDRIKNIREDDIPQEDRKIGDSEDRIEGISARSGVKSLSEYKTQLLSREGAEKSLDESISILNSHFGKVNDNLPENIAHWQHEISELENYEGRSQEVQYDKGAVTQLKERGAELRDELEALTSDMEAFRKDLEKIEKDTQWILGVEAGSVPCSSTVDLTPTYSKLQDYIDEIEGSRENILGVIDILEKISNEEQEKVSELFGEESAMTKLYRDITSGLYEEVLFSQQEKVRVKRCDGKLIEASKLSGGSYDQLYFSIRLALGNKILNGNPGFFIIDDPFIKADPSRLSKQMAMLKTISAKGWQIIYFSAKGEVKEALADDITNGIVNLVEIDNIRI